MAITYTVKSIKLFGKELLDSPEKISSNTPVEAARSVVRAQMYKFDTFGMNSLFKTVINSGQEVYNLDIYAVNVDHVPPFARNTTFAGGEQKPELKKKSPGRPKKKVS